MRIKAYEVIVNIDLFPVFFCEASAIIFHGFNKEGVSVDFPSENMAQAALAHIVRTLATTDALILDLDAHFAVDGVSAYKMSDDAVPPHTKMN